MTISNAATLSLPTLLQNAFVRKGLIMSAMLFASPAFGQTTNCMANGPFLNCNGSDGSYTTCNSVGNSMLNCNTMGGHRSGTFSENSRNEPSENPAASDGDGGGLVGFIRSVKERRVHSKVNKALKIGDCPAAVREAFEGSDVDFALRVQGYCAQYSARAAGAP